VSATTDTLILTPTDARLERIEAKLDRLLEQLSAGSHSGHTPRAPMRIKEFAAVVGYDRKTIGARVKRGEIRSVCGRIPASELAKFGL